MSTHWRKILESEYLAGADLDDGKGKHVPIIATIKQAKREEVLEPGTSRKEQCLVLYFREKIKPMICNVTNAKAVSKATGSQYIEGWEGKRVTIKTERVKAFGEIWDALRIEPKPPVVAVNNQLICADCGESIKEYRGVTAEVLAAATLKKYNRQLCYKCSTVAKSQHDPISGGDQIAINP